MNSIGQLWHPIWLLWWTVIGVPIHAVLSWLLSMLNGNVIADAVGPFGVAIVLLTIVIKLILAPVFQFQLTTSRRVQAEQRRIAPQLAAVRKKYKKDPQDRKSTRLNSSHSQISYAVFCLKNKTTIRASTVASPVRSYSGGVTSGHV